MLQKYVQHETLEEYRWFVSSKEKTKPNQNQKTPNPAAVYWRNTVSRNPILHQVHEHSTSVFF